MSATGSLLSRARSAAAATARRATSEAQRTLAALGEVVAPARCLACQARVAEPGEGEHEPWCAPCATSVVVLGDPFCLDCAGSAARTPCRRESHLRCVAAVQYGEAVAALVRATKYEGWEPLLDDWLRVWVAALADRAPELPELLVAVPIHAVRRRERGLAVPERWAARLSAWHGVSHAAALERRYHTRTQVGLDRAARARNVEGAFAAGPEWRAVAGRRVALVDDVVTSGATARESANLLRSLGARQVEVWCLAHEPLE